MTPDNDRPKELPVAVSMSDVTREVLYRCNTIREAEAFIAGMEQFAPERVHAGHYVIDATEEADAEYQALRNREKRFPEDLHVSSALDAFPDNDNALPILRDLAEAVDHDIFTDAPEYSDTVAWVGRALERAQRFLNEKPGKVPYRALTPDNADDAEDGADYTLDPGAFGCWVKIGDANVALHICRVLGIGPVRVEALALGEDGCIIEPELAALVIPEQLIERTP